MVVALFVRQANSQERRAAMGRAFILWLLGVPFGLIILLWLFGGLN
jgi:hypothetical protein